VPLSRFTVSSLVLTVALSISGQLSSRDDLWGAPAWQGSGYGGSEEGNFGVVPRGAAAPGAVTPGAQDPAWGYGGPSTPGTRGLGFGRSQDDQADAWGQGRFTGPLDQVAPGIYPGSGPDQAPPPGRPWRGVPDYQDYVFRPPGVPGSLDFGPGQAGSGPGSGYADPSLEAFQGYRFRGDPPAYLGQWQSAPDDTGYRFRPLTDQERWRWGQPEIRPRYTQGAASTPIPGNPLLQPEAELGFEPPPWRAR